LSIGEVTGCRRTNRIFVVLRGLQVNAEMVPRTRRGMFLVRPDLLTIHDIEAPYILHNGRMNDHLDVSNVKVEQLAVLLIRKVLG
jgi:hypothetical protein